MKNMVIDRSVLLVLGMVGLSFLVAGVAVASGQSAPVQSEKSNAIADREAGEAVHAAQREETRAEQSQRQNEKLRDLEKARKERAKKDRKAEPEETPK